MNKGTFSGILIAIAGIAIGLYLDGGKIQQMLQPTAAMIVFGGTLGAVMVQFPLTVLKKAMEELRDVFIHSKDPGPALAETLMRYAIKARRNGVLSLDSEIETIQNEFLRRAVTLAVDGTHPAELRKTMELEMEKEMDQDSQSPRVFEAAGGFAPTIGILGAVIGLIQVMQRLENINEVGKGIAVAFVATIYGVGSANLFFLPCAGRIKTQMRRKQALREMMLDGVIGIVEKTNTRLLEANLELYSNNPAQAAREELVLR